MDALHEVIGPIAQVPLSQIALSPTNPRKNMSASAFAEMVDSVKAHGVIQPILLRSVGDDAFEIVFGARRFRAAQEAQLATIPAMLRVLDDRQVGELQMIENLQRADLHPIEEAEGYEVLMSAHGHTVDTLIEKMGKSKAYIYARLKLLALTKKAREAFYNGKLNPSVALLLARVPVAKLQDEALAELIKDQHFGEPMSVRQASAYLQQHYMLRLNDAPFPRSDAELVPAAGTCGACPKRTGNQPELFGDVKGADVCTDPQCFSAKKIAWVTIQKAKAESTGQKVISGKKAAAMLVGPGMIGKDSGVVALDAKNYDDPKARTNREILGKNLPDAVTLVEDEQSGKLIEVVDAKSVKDKLPRKVINKGSASEDTKAKEAKARLDRKIAEDLLDEVLRVHSGEMHKTDIAMIALDSFERADHETVKHVLKRWVPDEFAKAKDSTWALKEKFAKRIPDMKPAEWALLMLQIALCSDTQINAYTSRKPTRIIAIAERLKIDVAQHRKTIVDAAKPKTAPKPKDSGLKPAKQKTKAKPAAKSKTAKPKKAATKIDAKTAAVDTKSTT